MSTVTRPPTGSKKKGKRPSKRGDGLPAALRGDVLQAALDPTHGDSDEVFEEWARYLTDRRSPVSLAELTNSPEVEPLFWCLPKVVCQQLAMGDILPCPRKQKKNKEKKETKKSIASRVARDEKTADCMNRWLDSVSRRPTDEVPALMAVGWCRRLPRLSGQVSPHSWRRCLEALLRLSKESATDVSSGNPWVFALMACELPLSLVFCFPELPRCAELAPIAAEALERNILESLDGQGMPAAAHIGWFSVLAACWTRCLAMMRATKKLSINGSAFKEFDWHVRHLLRLTRADYGMPFESDKPDRLRRESTATMVRAALVITGDREDRALSKVVLDGKSIDDRRLPDSPGYHSEWSQIAILQPEWDPQQPRLTVDFSSSVLRTELCNRGEVVFSTDWNPTILANGHRLEPQGGGWESACWFTDFDVDFLELEMTLTGGWKLQRQFLMARQDYFLYAADHLVGPNAADLDYRLKMSFADGVKLQPKAESREGLVRGKRGLVGLVVPPALPEWRSDPRPGELLMRDGVMELQHRQFGAGLCAPLFIDLHRRRMKKPVTWRQLTIADRLAILPLDQAVGFRVHIGPEQWLIYRSLAPPGNRTILGQNLTSEFKFARLLKDGDIEPLVEIE